ncbi:acyl-CoA N-acyltransferase [Zopfia rhizophila CBS 207.26]|uniref:Acyl-CoA N-acyltransferase n=1 Tax=Zopfia rhizophila CBS 207.26 TaxID=1314779 RepID=A0A6A6D7U1_9PEZI|nr:acyl-CoA N-acyltransferase [Zopfia rhizophila CBS 207.26]
MSDPFRSKRLCYRAVATPEDDWLFQAINDDRIGYQNSNVGNNKLPTKADAAEFQKIVAEGSLLGAVICIQPTSSEDTPGDDSMVAHKPVGIGQIHLKALPIHMQHHRHTEIAIDILPKHQGKGYGTEAIKWVLNWAFKRLGLHRVSVRAFGWNERAISLYEKLGFVHEGRYRESLWHEGRWWDGIDMGLLEHEWRAMQEQEESKGAR